MDAPSSTEERSEVVEALLLDLLRWVVSPRPYRDVMDAWRTSCPRLPVWEEANRRGPFGCSVMAASRRSSW